VSTAVTSLSVERTSFPVVNCVQCGKQSLTYADFEGDDEVRRCLACDAPVSDLSQVGKRTVESLGYVFIGRDRSAVGAKPAQSKCGSKGVRSCGSGGCSSGSCGTGGGCGGGCSSKK
jgi:uncharacterized membrane protein YgcG